MANDIEQRSEAPSSRSVERGGRLSALKGAARGITRKRKVAAFVVAIVSDAISIPTELAPPLQWAVDLSTAIALFALLGLRWMLLPALLIEAVPFAGVFPAWTLAVLAIAGLSPTTPEKDRA